MSKEMVAMQSTLPQGRMRWSRLHAKMTFSYVWVTVVSVLLLEVITAITVVSIIIFSPILDNGRIAAAKRQAQLYAASVSEQTKSSSIDVPITFMPGLPFSLAPYNISTDSTDTPVYVGQVLTDGKQVAFALLIGSDGTILASSYPSLYPAQQAVAHALPDKATLIKKAMAGQDGGVADATSQGRMTSAVVPVWNQAHQPVGAVYVQLPPVVSSQLFLQNIMRVLLVSGLFLLIITVPIGGIFGSLTTRGLVRRVDRLVAATTQFAAGDYRQRVAVTSRDEVGQLEQQFNIMAAQLVSSIEQQHTLTEQNARLAERTRIARDLHDSVKQQAFAVSMQIGAALTLIDTKEEQRKHLLEAETLAYQLQQELTVLIRELRPLALQDKSFSIALQEYLHGWERQHSLHVTMATSGRCELSEARETALLRVLEEALSNVVRHSHATEVEVIFTCEQEQVTLAVRDNGVGFENGVNESGVGLHSMRERMEALQGTLQIESKSGQGTRIIACYKHCVDTRVKGSVEV